MNDRDQELWDKSTTWDSADDGRGGLKIRTSVAKFADLIRADEREACAELCEATEGAEGKDCAKTIRKRGSK